MSTRQTSSRLEMMQARFQQKQLQEKEQKLLQLYDQQQQRAYQVVQRASAGSNASTGSTKNQRTGSRTSIATYTTSSTQGGKVRQMFDERRQTTKGIDRSYPLEPLDNKLKKDMAMNGHSELRKKMQTKNQNFVSAKPEMPPDVNSNTNGSKQTISYHEEITCRSLTTPLDGNIDERVDENQRYDNRHEAEIEKVLDTDTIQRNRMMAKIHLLDFDDSMKHRVKNDLESEQFPEDFMIDVPEKILRKNVNRTVSQSEARLERFRSQNTKKNTLPKNLKPAISKKIQERTLSTRSTTKIVKDPSLNSSTKKVLETRVRTSSRKSESASPSKSPDTTQRNSMNGPPVKSAAFCGSERLMSNTKRSGNTVDSTKVGHIVSSPDPDDSIKSDEATVEADLTWSSSSKKNHETNEEVEPIRTMTDRRSSSASSNISHLKDKMATKTKSGARTPKTSSISSKSTTDKSAISTANNLHNLLPCKICGRRFAQERIELHEQICMKTAQKKRKQFDTMMFRVKGTDLEPFVKKGMSKKQIEAKAKKPESKSNWRRKHEDFINAIRSAKHVQAHLAAGGKLSDLPPPPVSDTSDYIQCPHCGRKFNQAAAERHIPKCQHMLHNKTPNARTPLRSKR